ncbi:hypothetical protein ACN3XK_50695 [Actinomadura welshii]
MPESVLADQLVQASFDGVAAATEGPPLVFASQAAPGANIGQAWDAATGIAIGPPIPDFPADRAGWAFGAPAGSPVVAWTHRDRVHVHDLGTGRETAVDGQPDLVGLAAHTGRAAVVGVFGPASDAEVVVWDVVTGERLAAFTVWLGHRTAIDRWVLHATPATGPLIGLPGDSAVSLLDVERGEEVASLPAACTVLGPTPDGLVAVQPAPDALHVRGLDGGQLAVLPTGNPCDLVAVSADDPLVAAACADDPGTVLVWAAAATGAAPSFGVKVPSPVNDLAVAPGATLVAATDTGLYTASLPG